MIAPLLAFLFINFQTVLSTYVVHPLDDQLPTVARVGQPFSWTFSGNTFDSSGGGPLVYSSTDLPSWLSFDPATRTFSGTPSLEDEGAPRVTVVATATAGHSSASSSVTLCVTRYPPPSLNLPISDQFTSSNRALSSAFTLSPGSALATPNPGLRIPTGPWSFSIGFEGKTFTSPSDLFYTVRLANGSEIPVWMVFNPYDITLDGNVPAEVGTHGPETFPMILVASDQDGYSAETLPFSIIVANHELSAIAQELPTINVTAGSPFTASLLSPADFTGFLVDGGLIQPPNISSLVIDTAGFNWLRYTPLSRTLSGTPPSNLTNSLFKLPAILTTWFNQSVQTSVAIQLVPSYFSLPELPALHLSPGEHFDLDLNQYYSNSTAGQHGETDISISFEPPQAADFIQLNRKNDSISGTIPNDYAQDHLTVSLTAYSQVTHSTSHATLIIFIDITHSGGNNPAIPHPNGLSVQAHRQLVLGLAVTFGILGGLLVLSFFFAWVRRMVQVEDSALIGEEGRYAWTKQDRRYYGLDTNSEKSTSLPHTSPTQTQYPRPPILDPMYTGSSFGHDLQRVPGRIHSANGNSDYEPSVMSKREFMARVKQTVRQVSNRYNVKNKPQRSPPRPVIGRPILLRPSAILDINALGTHPIRASRSNPFDDVQSQRASTFMTGSPSTSTAEHSIPRRRADFAPPRSMVQVHFEDGHLIRQPSSTSVGSDRLDVASRRTSTRSGRSTSLLSHEFYPDVPVPVGSIAPTRPRLVPFTSSTRVPVPRVSSIVEDSPNGKGLAPSASSTKTRVASQRAKVIKPGSPTMLESGDGMKKSASGDELSMGLHYMQSLGLDQPTAEEGPKAQRSQEATRYVVRTGEKFHIRLQIPVTAQKLQAIQVSGQDLPKFLKVDANGAKGMVEFTGTALSRDLGMITVGIYADKECISKVILEVIPRR